MSAMGQGTTFFLLKLLDIIIIDISVNPASKGMFSWSKYFKKIELDPNIKRKERGALQSLFWLYLFYWFQHKWF